MMNTAPPVVHSKQFELSVLLLVPISSELHSVLNPGAIASSELCTQMSTQPTTATNQPSQAHSVTKSPAERILHDHKPTVGHLFVLYHLNEA